MTGTRDITQSCCSPNFAGTVTNKIEQSFYSVYSYSGIESKSNLSRIIILQKKAIRILSKVNFDSHTDPHVILTFQNIYFSQIGNFMFCFSKGLLPNSFSDMFKLSNQIHSYNTRNSNIFFISHSRTNIRQFSIRFRGPKFFNSLPFDIANCKSIGFFNKKLKKFLLC